MKPTLWLALSGGLDSVVLLHFVKTYFPDLAYIIKAIHINHQLQPAAIKFEQHCQELCKHLNISLESVSIKVRQKKGESLEANAREARHQKFKKILNKNDLLLTAHHQDDQAETFLLQLLRGAGLRGVSAMPGISLLGKGFLMRPLLSFSRENLLGYAYYHDLSWIEDPSNQEEKFDRNYLRRQILPLLKAHWPQASKIFSRFAHHCSEQETLLQQQAEKDYDSCCGDYTNSLLINELKYYSPARQKNLLRFWLHKHKLIQPPSEKILTQIIKILHLPPSRNPVICVQRLQCRRYKDNLFLLTPKDLLTRNNNHLTFAEITWCKNKFKNKNILAKIMAGDKSIHIKFRQGGEKFKPCYSVSTQILKKLFQQWQVPSWLRDKIPLIYYQEKLIAVVGYGIAEIK